MLLLVLPAWLVEDPQVVDMMSRVFGEPFKGAVPEGDEGCFATRAGMPVRQVVLAPEMNRRYVPKRERKKQKAGTDE